MFPFEIFLNMFILCMYQEKDKLGVVSKKISIQLKSTKLVMSYKMSVELWYFTMLSFSFVRNPIID